MINNNHEIPRILPATGNDRYIYYMKSSSLNSQIQAVLLFAQHLDAGILNKAVRLSLDAEPVLGCFFVEDPQQPFWQRYDQPDNMLWFDVIDNNEPGAVEEFLKSPFAVEGQQLNVRLVRIPKGDALCVKINHTCSDAGGLNAYLNLLAGLYTRLQVDPGFQPQPNIQGRRDLKPFFDAQGIQDPLALFQLPATRQLHTWAFPFHGTEGNELRFSMRRLHEGTLGRIISYGKTRQATVTAVLNTAFFRAMFQLAQPVMGEEMGINFTMDLRRSSPNQPRQTICNLSLTMEQHIPRLGGEPFAKTLPRVQKSLADAMEAQNVLALAVATEKLGAIDYSKACSFIAAERQQMLATGKCRPCLSNIGVVSPLHFGQIPANDLLLYGPNLAAPGFLLVANAYNHTLTLEVTYYEPAHNKAEVEALLDLMEMELRSL